MSEPSRKFQETTVMLQQVLARLFQMKELSKYFYRTLLQICILGHVELFLTPLNSSLPGSFVHGILQAGMLEWVAMLSFRRSSRIRD